MGYLKGMLIKAVILMGYAMLFMVE